MSRVAWEPSQNEIQDAERLAGLLTVAQLADYLGVSERTLHRRLADHDGLRAAYKKGRARTIGVIASQLVQAARDGNITAQIFYLKTQAGWRERDVIEHRHVLVERLLTMTPEELLEIETSDSEDVIRGLLKPPER